MPHEKREVTADTLGELLSKSFNAVIDKYKGWKRYPRKIKKFLKREGWWDVKNCQPFDKLDLKIEFN